MSEAAVCELFRASIPDIDSMLDRLGTTPVLVYINSTLKNGLPSLRADHALLEHVKYALQTILVLVANPEHPVSSREKILRRIAEAYQACQVIQAQVIDAVYGMLVGRDAGLRDQVLTLVDEHKQQTLDNVTIAMHPNINNGVEGPHVQNRLLLDVGTQLGLRGVARARQDRLVSAAPISRAQSDKVIAKFHELFNMQAVLEEFIDNINVQDGIPRHISQEALMSWAQENGHLFPAHCIFYNEDAPESYSGRPKNPYLPYLSRDAAIYVLQVLFGWWELLKVVIVMEKMRFDGCLRVSKKKVGRERERKSCFLLRVSRPSSHELQLLIIIIKIVVELYFFFQ